MKNAISKEELRSILSEIITDEENNIYFTHITGASCEFFLTEGEGILTSKEIAERGYHDYDFDDEDILELSDLEDEYFKKNRGLEISDDELLELKQKYCKESARSFFENGLYAETTEIRDTASELRGNAKGKIADLVSGKGFLENPRGHMVIVLEIPKDYIYGENKESLFQTVEPMEAVSGNSHVATYTKCIPNHFIKSAIIVEHGVENSHLVNEYMVVDNENFRQMDQQSMLQMFREKLEKYDSLYTEEQFKLYDEAERLGVDFKKELDIARARIVLKNDMREYFNGKKGLSIEEINARCTELGLDFNNEMQLIRDKKVTLPIAEDPQNSAKKIASQTLVRDMRKTQAELKEVFKEIENPTQTKETEGHSLKD